MSGVDLGALVCLLDCVVEILEHAHEVFSGVVGVFGVVVYVVAGAGVSVGEGGCVGIDS